MTIENKNVVLVAGNPDNLGASVKTDSTPADVLKRGIPLVEWPEFSMVSLEEPTTGAGHRPFSLHATNPVIVHAVADKAAARILKPLVIGSSLGDIKIMETMRANAPNEVVKNTLLLTNAYLSKIGYIYREELSVRFPPGLFIRMEFLYVTIALTTKQIDPLTLTPTGETTGTYDIEHAVQT